MRILWRLLLGLVLTASATGQTIDLRMSVKIILNPDTGVRPNRITPDTLTNAVAAANQRMASYWRACPGRHQRSQPMV